MRIAPNHRSSFYFLFFCYAAGVLLGLTMAERPVCMASMLSVDSSCHRFILLFWAGTIIGVALLHLGRKPSVRAVAALLLAVGCGYGNVGLSRRDGGLLPTDCLDGQRRMYDVEVLDFGKETAKSWQKTVRVAAYGEGDGEWEVVRATLCLYFQKDSASAVLAPGDRLTVSVAPIPIDAEAYAGYARYMRRRHIYASAYVPQDGWRLMRGGVSDSVAAVAGVSGGTAVYRLRRIAGRLQARLTAGLAHPRLNERERGIAKALIFGDKSELDPVVSQAYRHAGVVHVLCVSGMHLGILSCLLMVLLKRLDGRTGRWMRFGIICLFLWGYALVTGLSASVCRAASMFTFVQAGLCFGRRLPVERSLFISAWFLLLLRPEWLLDLGFLLSYMAVGGIVFFVPKTYPAVVEKHKLLKKLVAMSAVSWAAQCGTGPLGIYCFGQFPVYFWVANLVVAPLASVLLPIGLIIGLVGCSVLGNGWLMTGVVAMLQEGIAWMNGASLWIERWPGAVWRLTVSGFSCLCCYGVLYCCRQAVSLREKRYLPYAAGLIWIICVL